MTAIQKMVRWLEQEISIKVEDPEDDGYLIATTSALRYANRLADEEAEEQAQKPIKIPLGRGLFALIDAEDYPKVKDYSWHIACQKKPYPARSIKKNGSNALEFMHRVILNPPDGMFVDHIDGDRLDNRKCNLRICTDTQNRWNKKMNVGSSTFKGVHKNGGRWRATISANGIKYQLGSFGTEIEAAIAYNMKAKELHGEFAKLNTIDGVII